MSIGSLKAKGLIKELGIDDVKILVESLNDICMARGLYVREGHIDGAEARLTIGDLHSNVKGVILVRPNHTYETRTRFSIAHELGHFELHKNISSSISCSGKAMNEWFGKQAHQTREVDANEFASELLLPEQFVKTEINDSKPSLNLVQTISEKYDTSFLATARRLVDLTQEGCALVFFNRERVMYHVHSPTFKQQGYWIAPGPLDSSSMAHDAAINGRNGTYMSTVAAETWIDTSEMKDWQREKIQDAEVREQAHYFPNLEFGISLVWLHQAKLIWN